MSIIERIRRWFNPPPPPPDPIDEPGALFRIGRAGVHGVCAKCGCDVMVMVSNAKETELTNHNDGGDGAPRDYDDA